MVPEVDWAALAGWSPWSGRELDAGLVDAALDACEAIMTGRLLPREATRLLLRERSLPPSMLIPAPRPTRPRVVAFGMGQYAKVVAVPRVRRHLDLACWHEIDPTQIGRGRQGPWAVRTSGLPEPDERPDAFLLAGYHHTHAPIAVTALERGASVIVEKPIATTNEQLDALLAAMAEGPGRVFVGFHKRYNPLTAMAREDLQLGDGRAVSMRCIVYEIPLPRNHWYLWPESRGRVLGNGCHWIDYCLCLNDWARPTRIESRALRNGDVVVTMDLENGASLAMTITEHGSDRLGVREHIHLTAGRRTATIRDDHLYEAESSTGVLRRHRVPKMAAFEKMYEHFGGSIAMGVGGDSTVSVEVSGRAALEAAEGLS
jgi:predicted dehydrogenase